MPMMYHDFSALGLDAPYSKYYAKNQRVKEPVLRDYMQRALDACPHARFAELFCADGYYTILARRLGAAECYGFDINADRIRLAEWAVDELGMDNVYFRNSDVMEAFHVGHLDVVACLGGLYHMEDPLSGLKAFAAMTKRFLVIQTVVSLVSDDPAYLVSHPATSSGHGSASRFSRAWLDSAVGSLGGEIVESDFNRFPTEPPKNAGSAYYLIDMSPLQL